MSHGAGAEAIVTFEIVPLEATSFQYRAIFAVPRGLEVQLASNSVNARGAQFELKVGSEPGTIVSEFESSDPNGTAEAIRQRLVIRIKDPSPPGAEECAIM